MSKLATYFKFEKLSDEDRIIESMLYAEQSRRFDEFFARFENHIQNFDFTRTLAGLPCRDCKKCDISCENRFQVQMQLLDDHTVTEMCDFMYISGRSSKAKLRVVMKRLHEGGFVKREKSEKGFVYKSGINRRYGKRPIRGFDVPCESKYGEPTARPSYGIVGVPVEETTTE